MHSSTLNFTFPFQKINKEQRIVTGIATADNPDLVDDVVNFDASMDAFSNWIGNIREMHSPIAVGKLVDWKPVPVTHNGDSYNGIEVSVYISKGAENTWQKILDGTLRGFSIGGTVQESKKTFWKKLGRNVNEIVKYTLGELSVVDNPCNPAGTFSIIKSVDGKLEYVAESVKDIFYCDDDHYISVGGTTICPVCEDDMIIIGSSEDYDDVLINKFIDTINDSFTKALSDINTVPTDSMAAEARRGLEWRKEFGRGGTPVGVARARDIQNKKELSISTVRRMHSFFARHEIDKQGKGFSQGEEGYPSAGRIAWALWGGDPGKSWSDAIVKRIENMSKSNDMCKGCAGSGSVKKDMNCPYCGGDGVMPDGEMCQYCDDNGIIKAGTDCPMCKSVDTGQIGAAGGGIKKPQQGIDDNIYKVITERDGEFCVMSEDGSRSFGCYPTKAEARRRLAQVESFSKAATKREDGEDFPAEAFAYVPDAEKPSTWKLRLWDSLDQKETVAQVSRAVSAISSSGFRGNRVQIPSSDMAQVKAKIRAAWRRVNGPDRELPPILKEAIQNMNNIEKMMPSPSGADVQVIDCLRKAVSDSLVMYVHAHGYHWNVRGDDFAVYHSLFGDIYSDVFEGIDPLAEYIVKLGGTAPKKVVDIMASASVGDIVTDSVDPQAMVQSLAKDNDAVLSTLNTAFQCATTANQQGLANFLADRIDHHQKWAWQLKVSDEIYEEEMEDVMTVPGPQGDGMVSKNNEDLQLAKNYDNIDDMSQEELTDTQKKNILAKLGNFLFGEKSVEKGQVVDVNNMNHTLRIVSEGNMDQAPHVTVNVGGGMLEDLVGDSTESMDVVNATRSENVVGGDAALSGTGTSEYTIDTVKKSAESEDDEATEGEEEMDFEKVLEGLGALLDEKLEKVKADITAEVDGKIDAIEKSVSEVKDSAEEISNDLEKVANSGAVKKSADVDADEEVQEDEETLEKSAESDSFWGGIFVPAEIVKVLGYDS